MNNEQALKRVVEKKKRSKITFLKESKVTKQKYLRILFDGENYFGIRNDKISFRKRDSLTPGEILDLDEIKKVKTINPGLTILNTIFGTLAIEFGLIALLTIISGGYSL